MIDLGAALVFLITLGISASLSYSYYTTFRRKKRSKPVKVEEAPTERAPGTTTEVEEAPTEKASGTTIVIEEIPTENASGTTTREVVKEESERTVDAELDRLRLEIWRNRRRRVKLMGRLFLAGGLVSLVAGYFSGYFGLELIAGVTLPLGVLFSFAGNEPYMKSSLAGQSVVSTMQVLQEALRVNSDRGHAIFIPKNDSDRKVMMFIPKNDDPRGSTNVVGTEGHYYPPLGHELFRAYLKEIGGRTEKELYPLLDQLRTVLTSGLELVEDVKFDVNQSTIEVRIQNTTFAEIGKHPELVKDVYARMGCPVTSSIAEWITYGMNARVDWLDARIDLMTRSAIVKLSIGRRIKE